MFSSLTFTAKMIAVGAGILILGTIIFLVWYSARKAGKAKGSINISNPVDDTGTAPKASEAEIRTLSQKIYDDMNGLNGFGHNIGIWQDLLTLSDGDFIRVYNEYNKEHQKATGQTFREWVDAESDIFQSSFSTVKTTVLQRMNKLKLV